MIVFLIITLALFAVLYLREHMKYRNLHGELLYVNERLRKLTGTNENGFVLIPSENQGIRELSAGLNRLLQSFYLERTDYTRRKQTMTRTLTNISHDLRTPLTVLKGYCEMLNLQTPDSIPKERLRELLSGISKKTDELIAAMEENFTLSKLESGDIRMNLKPVNLSLLCREMILDYYDLLERESFEVAFQISEMPLFVQADSEALKRILKNLIDNALTHGSAGKYLGFRLIQAGNSTLTEYSSLRDDFIMEKDFVLRENSIMTEDSVITEGSVLKENSIMTESSILKENSIMTEDSILREECFIRDKCPPINKKDSTGRNVFTENSFLIEIEDHGEGIPEKELARIFNRNYTVSHKSTGNGLGLTIAQGLALRMGGRIEVYSIPGERTVFTLILKSVEN